MSFTASVLVHEVIILPRIIAISGTCNAGKGTGGKFFREDLNYRVLEAGVVWQRRAEEAFGGNLEHQRRCAEKNPDFDRQVDAEIWAAGCAQDYLVVDARTARRIKKMRQNGQQTVMTIFFDCGVEERSRRMIGRKRAGETREGPISVAAGIEMVKNRDNEDFCRLEGLYEENFRDDNYDLVFRTDGMDAQQQNKNLREQFLEKWAEISGIARAVQVISTTPKLKE